MIFRRAVRAVPFVLLSAAAGFLISLVFGFPPFIGAAGCAVGTAILIGRDIWRERKVWDDLEQRFAQSGLDIRDHY